MTAPVRLQLSRGKGFDLQVHSRAINGLAAVSVARPTQWGNPFVVEKIARELAGAYDWSGAAGSPLWCIYFREAGMASLRSHTASIAPRIAVEMFSNLAGQFAEADPGGYGKWLAPLRGRNLACWCKPDAPCHADLLLELANGEEAP